MTSFYDIIRGVRTAYGQVFGYAATQSETLSAVAPCRISLDVAAWAYLRQAVLLTAPEVWALEIVLEYGARYAFTDLLVSEDCA